MEVIHSILELRARLEPEPAIAFVPTMGNLHAGHIALMRRARESAPCIVASIFVNRLQFGPGEDFDKYPRTFEQDCESLRGAQVDVVFAPFEQELYPQPQQVMIEPPPIARELEGAFRPGHFKGVATIVLKLFNIVQPQFAVFGKKDYQQLQVITAMVEQLNLPIEIVAHDTIRDADGLALSSRNRYLDGSQRRQAAQLNQILGDIKQKVEAGNRDFPILEQSAKDLLDSGGWRVDYVAVRKSDLDVPSAADKDLIVLAAAWLGQTRLIDNMEIKTR